MSKHRLLRHFTLEPPRTVRAAAKTAVFLLKVLPMLPSRPLDRLTPTPLVERVTYPTPRGPVEGDLYRPAASGPHPGVVVCLGVVPFGVDHPQVPRLGEALARSGFAALLYWSPAMRDLRLDPDDVEGIALAYRWLVERPDVDPAGSGLIGTCVGGSFSLMAAASPLIRDRVSFVFAFAPYSSMWTLAQQVASSTRLSGEAPEHWDVDQLTRQVFVRSLTDVLEPSEAALLRAVSADGDRPKDLGELSAVGRAVAPLLAAPTEEEAKAALRRFPDSLRERLDLLSPINYLAALQSPLVVLAHDRDDQVIPIGESRRLRSALAGRADVRYTEFVMFKHMDPTKVKLSRVHLLGELARLYRSLYPVFRRAVAR